MPKPVEAQISSELPIHLMTAKDVVNATKLSRVSIYRAAKEGRFPCPVKIGTRQIRWRSSDVQAWVKNLPSLQYGNTD